MRIGLIGYGKMGRAIEALAKSQNHSILFKRSQSFSEGNIDEVDVLFEFSTPESVSDHIKLAYKAKKNLVIGTTGHPLSAQQLHSEALENGIAIFFSQNFSIGVQLYIKLLEQAAKLFKDRFDPLLVEEHQADKKDTPSGTSLLILSRINQYFPDLPTQSIRLGTAYPHHDLILDGPFERISISHTIKSREGLAQGALLAANWIQGKTGFYTMEDLLNELK